MAQSINLMFLAFATFCIGVTSGRTVLVEHSEPGPGMSVTLPDGSSFHVGSPLYFTMEIIPSPLLKVSQPMMDICRYYCAKVIPIEDWEKSTISVNNLISTADNNTANETIYKETVENLKKCSKYYRGDSDWNGNDHSNQPPAKNLLLKISDTTLDAIEDSNDAVVDYGDRVAHFLFGWIKKSLKVNEAKESEALKIINLLKKIVREACGPSGYSTTSDKNFQPAVTSIENVIREGKIEADLISPLTNTRKALKKCISHYRQKYWEPEDQIK